MVAMERSKETVSAIKALGYPSGSCLSRCRCDELPCPLLTWLSVELRTLCPELQDPDRTTNVLLVKELRHLLSSMSSPLADMTSDVLEPSVLNNVTEFLVSELLTARIMKHKESHPEENLKEDDSAREQRLEGDRGFSQEYEDTDAAEASRPSAEMQAEWILLLRSLGLGASSQLDDVKSEVKLRIDHLPGGEMANPLLKPILSSEQWREVKKINQVLLEDYGCRRQMMIKRFQVTLQSFAWGEKQKVVK
uniref:Family with sequence similarity 98, member C n=1 Tax=Nothobranchius furzeri TaxID=105023 RepID=A0A1A7ZUW8_NOTFU